MSGMVLRGSAKEATTAATDAEFRNFVYGLKD